MTVRSKLSARFTGNGAAVANKRSKEDESILASLREAAEQMPDRVARELRHLASSFAAQPH